MSKYDDLVSKLKEIFQIDRPELDFGVYRILGSRSKEIAQYLEVNLIEKVKEDLKSSQASDLESAEKELAEKINQYIKDGIDPEKVPRIQELRLRIKEASGGDSHENTVFSHLLTFFSRYYQDGDFISQRRFKGDAYSIPYSGEEVKLYWANKDQFYVKSGENFSNYTFKLDDGRSVSFRLVAADSSKDNRKDLGKDRGFSLVEKRTQYFVDVDGSEYEEELYPIEETVKEGVAELIIRFEYKEMPKNTKQDALVEDAVSKILSTELVKQRWLDIARREPTEKNPKRTLLEKCLSSYVGKNTADYFIHKNLNDFLKRELDFYIKNEIMYLDDLQDAESIENINKNLAVIKSVRAIGLDLIKFLSQIEEFQKKLWLKKKFVVSSNYCISVGRISQALYPEVIKNNLQWDQWTKLGLISYEDTAKDLLSKSVERSQQFLVEHPFLMIDTSLYSLEFKWEVLKGISNLDQSIDGVLICSDNFQALNFLQARYQEQVKSIYVDPPYNTDASEILYKNGYKNSSWISLMDARLELGRRLLKNNGSQCTTIDDFEFHRLRELIGSIFDEENILGVSVIKNNPSGRSTKRGFSISHEYGIFSGKSSDSSIGRLERNEKQLSRYSEKDDRGFFEWVNFRKHGGFRSESPKSFFPIYITDATYRVPKMDWNDQAKEWDILEEPAVGEKVVYPIDENGDERRWKWGLDRTVSSPDEFSIRKDRSGELNVYIKARMNEEGMLPLTWWDKKEYSATSYGTNTLIKIFGKTESFSYPKSIYAVEDTLRVLNLDSEDICLDYFAGSGTTGHAVINLNREDGGKRKFLLVEQGEYFESVTKARMLKISYSSEWKDGIPQNLSTGILNTFKVIKLESYEDSLNNINLSRSDDQAQLLDSLTDSARDDYLMHYFLNIESKNSLLSVADFMHPFEYKLKISQDSAGAYKEQTIDLVETFNYLIGLDVKHIDFQISRGFCAVTGKLPTGEKAIILWRDVKKLNYEELNRLCDKLAINPADSEFDVVYINGDHNIPTVLTSTEAEGGITKALKIRQIEPEFMSRMFNVDS